MGDLELENQSPARVPGRLRNEGGLGSLVARTRDAVATARSRRALPLLVGGDCPVVLGALAALAADGDAAALVMIDGHEDAYPPARSPTGEASDSELGIALGLFDEMLPAELAALTPLLSPKRVALVGPRDQDELARFGVPSLADQVWLRTDEDLRRVGAQRLASEATAVVGRVSRRWWLHLDLDALSTEEFPAADYRQAGGLTWGELEIATRTILSDRRCAGLSVGIYNPDLDPGRTSAERVVGFLATVVDVVANRSARVS